MDVFISGGTGHEQRTLEEPQFVKLIDDDRGC
jgi:hypothetical protein